MATLRELQERFRDALLDGEPGALLALVRDQGLSPPRRLQVYRNNLDVSLGDALEATFPVVARLVGSGFFRAAARAFIRAHPPRRPCLTEYGGGFAGFLAAFAPAQALPYLPDVARLEWAVNEARHAENAPALDPQALGGLAPDRLAALALALHPAARLLESAFPVDRIWLANQPDGDAAQRIDLGEGGCRLLVAPDADGVVLARLDPAAFAFVNHVAAGALLTQAYERSTAVHGDLDLAELLARLFRLHAFAPPGAGR